MLAFDRVRALHLRNPDPLPPTPKQPQRSAWPLWGFATVWLLQLCNLFVLVSGLYDIYQAPKEVHFNGPMNTQLQKRFLLLNVYVLYTAVVILAEIVLALAGYLNYQFYLTANLFKVNGAWWFAQFYKNMRAEALELHATQLSLYAQKVLSNPRLAPNKQVHIDTRIMATKMEPVSPSATLVYMFFWFCFVAAISVIPAVINNMRDYDAAPVASEEEPAWE
ncbi:hypothetical protein LTR36_000891 [Oleoguttula mirabilis]|uniref:Uncharacterized protein n=1 Tax=Oleoguttula mirabilis TaxID=1507867 RepID=A0AAV9J3L4_9PEZI|nr:hypothetical protein LTR36_000891 [Oleoguttula mirabilis]